MIKGTLSRKFRKEKDMTKHILTKHILMALAMAAMVPAGQAWAITSTRFDADANELTVDTDQTVTADSKFYDKELGDFNKVIINYSPTGDAGGNRAMGIYSARYNLSNTDIVVNVLDTGYSNNDGLHLTNHFPSYAVRSYNATIKADNSDALNLSHDITSNEKEDSMVVIGNTSSGQVGTNGNGNLTAVVSNGNGIRANASIQSNIKNGITVLGKTDITINGGEVTSSVTLSNEQVDGMLGDKSVTIFPGLPPLIPPVTISAKDQIGAITVSAGYMPAAVYAGNDMYDFTCEASKLIEGAKDWEWASSLFGDMSMHLGNAAAGQGNIVLHDTNLTIQKSDDGKEGGYGLFAGKNGHIQVDGNLTITSEAANSYGIAAKNANLIYGDSLTIEAETTGILSGLGPITSNLEDYPLDTSKNTHGTSVMLGEGKDVSISMNGNNSYAMYAEGVDDTENNNANSITGKELNTLYAVGDMLVENGGSIDLGTTGEKTDNNGNSWGAYQLGAVIASGTNKVSDTDIKKSTYSLSSANANYISSESVIADAGDLNTSTDDQFNNKSVISALYAEDGADIKVSSGQSNTFLTKADPTNPDQLERVIWAYNGANITVDGTTTISTDSYKESPNSADIAIAAGTAVGISAGTDFNTPVNRAEVNLNYGAGSSVTGDIIAGYAGEVNISRALDAGDAGIQVEGNLLAGNNGILNVDLGNGGTLTGRADDYGDAGVIKDSEHTTFFDPAFSSGIYKGGAVNLTMGEGSRWNVTGQSWITSVTTDGNAVIDLTGAGQERNEGADALTIYNMAGDATFLMHLDGDRTGSDMLYMKSADGSYTIYLDEAVDESDIKGSHNELDFDNLRFATIGNGSKADFSVKYVGGGIYDINYQVGHEDYASEGDAEKNNVYNGTELGEVKPGTGMVEDFFTQAGTPPEAETGGASGASVLAAEEEPEDADDIGAKNYYIYGAEKTVNDTGKTIIAMSKVNYSNAVYMDRLNKRMGEARFLEGDDGLWVRLRHDRIGKSDAFRSKNTMFEIGYDWKDEAQKDGTHYRGFVFDYMRGTADYTNVLGEGDVRRAGLWYHDTWMGDKGHYTDYVVKYGRLSNDFDIYSELGKKIKGDYDNDVWSVSAEYGRKKDIGNDWYFEPQVQAQYAYVTSADYTTSQDTKVHLDSIDSLIGRAGFRLGRDTDEANTVYFKADILHEFLGGQSIRAMDSTGTLSTTYENEGTWYDVGFGFSHRMSEDKYMFLDVEKLFGNDNEDTYQVNIGLNMAF